MDKKYMVDREMLIFSFRYALSRQSTAPIIVQENLKRNLNSISDNDIKLYIREINDCDYYGMEMDKQSWLNFAVLLERELSQRNPI